MTNIIHKDKDGYYRPSTEDEIVNLVKYAYENGLQVRCRGAAHSVAHSIYSDPNTEPNKVNVEKPPEGPNINIMLDQFRKLDWIDKEKGLIEVEAGLNLGLDPRDPSGVSTLENSLLYQTFKEGWTLEDLGGITHQTVSGFQSTGSAGGTTMYTLEDNLIAFRVIDGMGNVEWVEKGSELYNAFGVSMGLLGIITKVRIQLTPNFYIYGQQITTRTSLEKCPIDLFGDGRDGKPSYEEYLRNTPYTRMLWWPQKGVDRVVIWEAVRGKTLPAFFPAPYKEFANTFAATQVEQLGASILFTTLGNKGFIRTWSKLQLSFKAFYENLKKFWSKKLGSFIAVILSAFFVALFYIIALPLVLFFSIFKFVLWILYAPIVSMLQPISKKGKAQLFMDYMWRSLPMDNEAGDILMGTEFTEIWIPLEYSKKVMNLLDNLFKEKGRAATGTYSTEIYAGISSDYWMSPAYKTDVIRVDVFWYSSNEGDPSLKGEYYEQFWELFVDNDVPFRLHWGKYLPNYDYTRWAEYLRSQTPKWDDFMALRAQRDPKNVFYTSYWKKHLTGVE